MQEKALDALIAYLRAADADAARLVLFSKVLLELSLVGLFVLSCVF